MKKMAFILLLALVALGSVAQSVDLNFTTHYYQSHELYSALTFVAKTETEVGSDCDVMEVDFNFKFDGKSLIKDNGEDIYDIIETQVEEGKVFMDAGTHKTYILTAKNRADKSNNKSSDLITISIVKDKKGKQNIIVTIAMMRFTGEVFAVETYSQLRE